jgi:PAS domain-containing protein
MARSKINQGIESLAAKRRFQFLVDGVTDCAIYMLDIDGNIASWNSGAQRINGANPQAQVVVNLRERVTVLARGRVEWRVGNCGTAGDRQDLFDALLLVVPQLHFVRKVFPR